jgi:flagellar export protein FliJ
MPFHFKLEKVLRYRRRRMESEARKLHTIESAALALEQASAQMEARCRELTETAATDVSAAEVEDRRRLTEFVRGQQHLIRRNAEEVVLIRHNADAQRLVLLDAQREVRVLELLRERQGEEWSDRQRRLDQKRIDEIASRGSTRHR